MPTNQERLAQLLSDSHFAFINSQNSEVLHLESEGFPAQSK